MTAYEPRENESNQVKYLRFLAEKLREVASKATSDFLKKYLSSDSDLHEKLADLLSCGKFMEQKSPEALDFIMEGLINEYGPLDVVGVLSTSAARRLILMKDPSIPKEDKNLLKKIDEETRKYSRTLPCPYIS